MFLLYNLLLALTSVVWLPLIVLGRRRRGRQPSLGQRLGRLDPTLRQTGPGAIWLHAVSAGEVLSCRVLVAQLRARLPAARIFVSTATAAGRQMAEENLAGQIDGVFYAPLDLAFAVRRVLRVIRPSLVVVAETEIWPNLYREAKRFGAGLLVVNARISDRSAGRYRRLRLFFRPVLALADAILAQSALDRRRQIEAGAPAERVEVGGNLKFDVAAAPPAPPEVVAWIERLKPETVVVAGSTREGEEREVLSAWRSYVAVSRPSSLLILAPRHPQRCEEVAGLLAASGLPFLRRSQLGAGDRLALPGVLLLDTLGELASVYRLAHVVFVGGSLAGWGGHNVLEPVFAGRPVVVGPHMQNFRTMADGLVEAGGLVQVGGGAWLGAALRRLIEQPEEAAAIAERGRRWAEQHRGAADRAAARAEILYQQALPVVPPSPWLRALLWLPARLWELAARLRGLAYRRGWLARRRLATCTISVGNLTAGGTGKTPAVLWLLEQLEARGCSSAVLTRGYRRTAAKPVTVLASGASASVSLTGDEAQLYLRHSRAALGIAADRYRAGVEVERRFQPDVILLDDGFQHQRLARNLDIVLIDATAPFGGGELLPLGRLREPLDALARADVLLITRTEQAASVAAIERELRRYNPHALILRARTEPIALVDAQSGREKPLRLDEPAVAFCGLGNPDAFWRTLERIGIPVVSRVAFPDHRRYSNADIARLPRAGVLVTTEKDVINLGGAAPPNLYWLRTRLVVERGDELIDRIESAVGRKPASIDR